MRNADDAVEKTRVPSIMVVEPAGSMPISATGSSGSVLLRSGRISAATHAPVGEQVAGCGRFQEWFNTGK